MKTYSFIGKKSGRTLYFPVLSEKQLNSIMFDCIDGFCLTCGNVQSGCEPDARKYKCENCGNNAVYGLEEMILRGWYKPCANCKKK